MMVACFGPEAIRSTSLKAPLFVISMIGTIHMCGLCFMSSYVCVSADVLLYFLGWHARHGTARLLIKLDYLILGMDWIVWFKYGPGWIGY